jgi:thioredoxin-related protein
VIAQTPQGIGYPTIVFLNEKLEMIQPFQGYLTAEQLEPIISFFGTDVYKEMKWEEFMKSFQSQLTSTN